MHGVSQVRRPTGRAGVAGLFSRRGPVTDFFERYERWGSARNARYSVLGLSFSGTTGAPLGIRLRAVSAMATSA